MTTTKRDEHGARGFAVPVLCILVLVGVYWLATDARALPRLLSSAIAAIS